MEYEVIWSNWSQQNFRRIYDFIAERDRTAADYLIETIINWAGQLGITPLLGQRTFPTDKLKIREVVSGEY
jgi:plasmid stabilization system protein ParE